MKNTGETLKGFVRVRGAREHNLKNIDLEIPRDAPWWFSPVCRVRASRPWHSAPCTPKLRRRYLESVSPYARRLFHQIAVPEVDAIDGLPPAVALRAAARIADHPLFRRQRDDPIEPAADALFAGRRLPPRQSILYAEGFSPNTPQGAPARSATAWDASTK